MTPTFAQYISEEVTPAELKQIEMFGDRLLKQFGIDIEFTRHFAQRMNDPRNRPIITGQELKNLFKKIAQGQGGRIKNHKSGEVVLKDIQKDLNIPVVLKYDAKSSEIDVVHKTVMRKKNFLSRDPFIEY